MLTGNLDLILLSVLPSTIVATAYLESNYSCMVPAVALPTSGFLLDIPSISFPVQLAYAQIKLDYLSGFPIFRTNFPEITTL